VPTDFFDALRHIVVGAAAFLSHPEDMLMLELRKQISLFVPLSEWKAIRQEAARQRIPMTELCRRWMKPGLDGLKRRLDRRDIESKK
jgi:hypothetical protein